VFLALSRCLRRPKNPLSDKHISCFAIIELYIVIFFGVDLDVFSIVHGIIVRHLIKSSLCKEDFDGGNPAAQPCDKEYRSGKKCKYLRQCQNNNAEANQQQPNGEYSRCNLPGCLRDCICVKSKIHFFMYRRKGNKTLRFIIYLFFCDFVSSWPKFLCTSDK